MSIINRKKSLTSNYNDLSRNSIKEYYDPIACYESFKKHWQQVIEVFLKFQDGVDIKQEDVVIIVNHLDQIISLLINFADKRFLEYLLKEKILYQLCHLSLNCDKSGTDLRIKQLRIYKVLISKFQINILNNINFLSPLTKLLINCHENIFSLDVEKILVSLLHQLCITLFQQNELLEFFFPLNNIHHDNNDEENDNEKQNTSERFVILSLLVSYIHREEELGRQARDALLLCLALSKDNIHVAQFIIHDSDLCPVLATGLSGLYSSLPRKLDIENEEWHRFTHEDVNNIPELSAFMLSLDFCNVVIQKSHQSVQNELLELLYKGFLEPVLGPALMQEFDWIQKTSEDNVQWTTDDELVAATVYLELFIRSVSHPGVLHSFIKFILTASYENKRVIDYLIQRMNASYRLSLVTLSLFETLIDLNCEDIMLELIFKYLIPCSHIMLSQRSRLTYIDPYCKSAQKFLSLIPDIKKSTNNTSATNSNVSSANNLIFNLSTEGIYGNYFSYLYESRIKIENCYKSTSQWTYLYDGENPSYNITKSSISPGGITNVGGNILDENCLDFPSLATSDNDASSGYESFKLSSSEHRIHEVNSIFDEQQIQTVNCNNCLYNTSIGNNYIGQEKDKNQIIKNKLLIENTEPSIGPFLDSIFVLLESMPSLDLYTNIHVTSILSRLAIYPQPLLYSFLLNHSLVFQPSIRSLFQILFSLKQKIENILIKEKNCEKIIKEAEKLFELRDIKINRNNNYINGSTGGRGSIIGGDNGGGGTFERFDFKRKSISDTIGGFFKRNNKEPQLESCSQGYRYINRSTSESSKKSRRAVLCAILLSEWLKELSAITQEHTVCSLNLKLSS